MTTPQMKDPATILHEAILICGDCPECGSDNWTDEDDHGFCESCGAKFSPTIPRQMLKARDALTALLAEAERLERTLHRDCPDHDHRPPAKKGYKCAHCLEEAWAERDALRARVAELDQFVGELSRVTYINPEGMKFAILKAKTLVNP